MERVIIGKITSPHGIKGEVKVQPLTDYPERFYKTKSVWVDAKKNYLTIESVRAHLELFLVKFQGIDERDEAEKLINSFLTVDQDQVMDLPPGHFYRFQIIGLAVYDVQETCLGELTDILETGANDVYVVKNEEQKELLIPALKSIVRKIDIEKNRMTVELPEGLND
ncbi:MAG: ribosome maturation factor RimM [Dehalobacterium sp.]